jgi:hypothetical protein
MTKGIDVEDIMIGTGDEAVRGRIVEANVRMFLHHGTEVTYPTHPGPRMKVDLGRRDCIPGLQRGIEGMRVGGVRSIVISPHLAYGEPGIPGRIPPNALLRCEVELLEVRERGVGKPEDIPPGKHLQVESGGGATRGLPWWQFFVGEDGRCGVSFVRPLSGLRWRNTARRGASIQLPENEITALIQGAIELQTKFPLDCLPNKKLWAGTTEQGFPFTYGGEGDKPCVTITVYEQGRVLCNFAMQEESPALLGSEPFRTISSLLKPQFDSEIGITQNTHQIRRLPD